MKKTLTILLAAVVVAFLIGITSHFAVAKKDGCVKIQDGILETSGWIPHILTWCLPWEWIFIEAQTEAVPGPR